MLGDARITDEAPADTRPGGVVGIVIPSRAPARPIRFKARVGEGWRCVGDCRAWHDERARRECHVADGGGRAAVRAGALEGQGVVASPRDNHRKREELIARGELQGVGVAGHATVIAIGAGIGHGGAKVTKMPESHQAALGALIARRVAGPNLVLR